MNRIFGSPLQYKQDGLYTIHAADFLTEERFRKAYAAGIDPARLHRDLHIEWRVYVCCWAASHAMQLDGDFVECGVNTAVASRAVAEYVNLAGDPTRQLYLLDTFEGLPQSQLTKEELRAGFARRYVYGETLDLVREKFASFPNVQLIQGMIPESLERCTTDKIAYLSIDMNAVVPEISAIRYFWPRLVDGAAVVLDDYNWRRHAAQRRAFDEFSASVGSPILPLPTGQGLMLKASPNRASVHRVAEY